MSLTKITDTDISTYGVISAADKLTGTAAQNKAVFDNLITNAVKTKFNALIDALEATSSSTGASQIGAAVTGVTGNDVQAILNAIYSLIDALDDAVVKVTEQTLTESQKTIARNNIGVTSAQVAVNSVNGRTGVVVVDKDDIYTELTGTLTAGQTSITLSNAAITENSYIDTYTSDWEVQPEDISTNTGSVTLTFEAQESDLAIRVRVS